MVNESPISPQFDITPIMEPYYEVILKYLDEQPRSTKWILLHLRRQFGREELFTFESVDQCMRDLHSKLKVCILLSPSNGNRTWGLNRGLSSTPATPIPRIKQPREEDEPYDPFSNGTSEKGIPHTPAVPSIKRSPPMEHRQSPLRLHVIREKSITPREERTHRDVLQVLNDFEEQVDRMEDITEDAKYLLQCYLRELKAAEDPRT